MGDMPTLSLPGDEALKLNRTYVVVNLDEFTSEVQGFHGYRLLLDGGEDNLLAIPLWYGAVLSRTSKLGAFMVALGEDTSKWIARKIQVKSWEERNRRVVEVEK